MKVYLLYKHGTHITLAEMKRARDRFGDFALHYTTMPGTDRLAWEEYATDGKDTYMTGLTKVCTDEDPPRLSLPRNSTLIGAGIDLNHCQVDRRFFEKGEEHMKGFICDRCGQVATEKPNNRLLELEIPELKQHAYLVVNLIGELPTPDLCTKCRIDVAERIIKKVKEKRG